LVQTKSLKTGHQIVGIVICVLLFPQWILGYVHHKQYPQKKRRTWITQCHRILGPAIILTAIANGSSGFKLADAPSKDYIGYGIVVGVVAIIIGVMMVLKMRQKKYAQLRLKEYGGVYVPGGGAYQSNIALVPNPPLYQDAA
jgi:hypothetical protein